MKDYMNKKYPVEKPNDNEVRRVGLGNLWVLWDRFIFAILDEMSAGDLQTLMQVSRAFYIYANDEDLWKNLAYDRWGAEWRFKGTWRATALLRSDSPKIDSLSKRLRINGFHSPLLARHWYLTFVDLKDFHLPIERQTIERVHVSELTLESFNERFASKNMPVLIVDGAKHWPAMTKWQFDSLAEPPYGQLKWRTTDIIPDGKRMYITLNQFVEYTRTQTDEDPIYMFDGRFDARPGGTAELANDYEIPPFFPVDALKGMQHPLKKPAIWRWLVIGPSRSSSGFHLDPLMSTAWNAVVVGHKRWALYPPNFPYPPGTTREWNAEDKKWVNNIPEPLEWYVEHYPHLQHPYVPFEIVQGPGDIIYVPSGWWHSVLNLDDTVSITHNFCDQFNVSQIYTDIERQAVSDEDAVDFLKIWTPQLREQYPDLWAIVESRPGHNPLSIHTPPPSMADSLNSCADGPVSASSTCSDVEVV